MPNKILYNRDNNYGGNYEKDNIFTFINLLNSSVFAYSTACGKPDIPEDQTNPSIISVDAVYNGNTYNFNANIPYADNINFNLDDFKIVLYYDNGETVDITSGFDFNVVKYDNGMEVPANEILPGSYKIKFTYQTYSAEIYFIVNQIEISEDNVVCSLASEYQYLP